MTDTTATGPILEVAGLKVTFRSREGKLARAVDGVDLSVGRAEIIALAGESGCGKTTLARTILGLEDPSEGVVSYDGAPLDRSRKGLKAYRRKVQLVLQDPTGSLNPRHTVYDSVAEGLRVHKIAGNEEELVSRALSRAGLRPPERYFLRYPHELSGGPAATCRHRGRARAGPGRDRRRRAGFVPRRLGPRRDPRAPAQAS